MKQGLEARALQYVCFFIFLILKLTNTIDWNWFWISSPITIPLGLALIGLILTKLVPKKKEQKIIGDKA